MEDLETTKVFDDSSTDNITKDTGVIDDLPLLTLETSDKELVANFRRWVSDADAYWNDKKGYDLESRRAKNERYYLGRQIDTSRLYQYQVPYQDNQLLIGVESIMAYVSGRTPGVEVLPEKNDSASKIMAEDLEYAMQVHSQRFNLQQKVAAALRNDYIKYLGVIKLQWDDAADDIVPTVVDPNNIIVDKDCKQGEEPRFICEVLHGSVAQILAKFPEAKERLMNYLGRERMTPKLQSQVIAYNEVWFTQYNKDGEAEECVAWYLGDFILAKSKNPNYYYKNEQGVQVTNFLAKPTKPYVFFNFINDGSKLIDQTTPLEQAIPLQDILNKRGRQIVENADTANSILVLRSGVISDEEAENITRDPNQILTLDVPNDSPLANSYGEIAPHLLPNYVLQDKDEIKNAIHNILGTPAQFRGDDNSNNVGTLGEAKMVQSQASGRQDAIVRSAELSLDRYFNLLLQMMKVYYTDNKRFATRDNSGNFTIVELNREKIPDVAWVQVEQGSMKKEDKERRENVAMTLANMGLIDPYNLFKDLGLKDADKRYESWVKFQSNPMALVNDVKSEIGDKTAYEDFAVIMNGIPVPPHDDITAEHIESHRKQMITDRFLYAEPEKRDAFIQHVQGEIQRIDLRNRIDIMSQMGMNSDPNIPLSPMPMPMEQLQMMQQPPMGGMPPQGNMPPNAPAGSPEPPMPENGMTDPSAAPNAPTLAPEPPMAGSPAQMMPAEPPLQGGV